MRTVTIRHKDGPRDYEVLERSEADARGLLYLQDWREATEPGQWVLSDDGNVVEILAVMRTNGLGGLLRTCTGTFSKLGKALTTERRECRYTLTGKMPLSKVRNDTKLRSFVAMLEAGHPPYTAYDRVYGVKSPDKRRRRVKQLLEHPEVMAMISQKLQDALLAAGLDESWVLKRFKSVVDTAEKESDKVAALNSLAKIMGMLGSKPGDGDGGGKFSGAPADLLAKAAEIARRRSDSGSLPEKAGGDMTSTTLSRSITGDDFIEQQCSSTGEEPC